VAGRHRKTVKRPSDNIRGVPDNVSREIDYGGWKRVEVTVFQMPTKAQLPWYQDWARRYWGLPGQTAQGRPRLVQFIYRTRAGTWYDAQSGARVTEWGRAYVPERLTAREKTHEVSHRKQRAKEARDPLYYGGQALDDRRSVRQFTTQEKIAPKRRRVATRAVATARRTSTTRTRRTSSPAPAGGVWREEEHPRRRDGTFRRK